jgi:hypothetical protein
VEAFAIDKKNGNFFGEMQSKRKCQKLKGLGHLRERSPQKLHVGSQRLPGYQQIGCHMIFDKKMDGQFTRKARFVANRNKTRDVALHHT